MPCRVGIVARREAERGETDDCRNSENDQDRRNDVGHDQAPRRAARLVLGGEEIHLERNSRRLAHFLGFNFKETGELEAEEAGDHVVREIFHRIIVSEDRVIEGLS